MERFDRIKYLDFRGKILFFVLSLTMLADGRNRAFAASDLDCSGMNHPAHQDEYASCQRMQIAIAGSEAGVDCVDCFLHQEDKPNPWVEALGIVAQPLAFFGASYFGSKFQMQSQKAWANAYEQGNQQCTNRFNSYTNYNVQTGANPILPAEAQAFSSSCNGNGMGGFAGYGGYSGNGYGGFGNSFLSGGYSPGFLGGMMGPLFSGGINFGMGSGGGNGGGYNPYGGGISGGIGFGGGNPFGGGGYNPYGGGIGFGGGSPFGGGG